MNIRVVQKGDIVYKNGCSPLFIRFTHWKIQCKLPPKTKRFCPLVLK